MRNLITERTEDKEGLSSLSPLLGKEDGCGKQWTGSARPKICPGRPAARLTPPIFDHVLGETPRTASETLALPETKDRRAYPGD